MTISFDNLIKIAKATQEAALLSEDNQSYVSDHLVNKRIEMIKKEFKEGMPKMEILFADNFFLTQINFNYKNLNFCFYINYHTKNHQRKTNHELNIIGHNDGTILARLSLNDDWRFSNDVYLQLTKQKIVDGKATWKRIDLSLSNIYNQNNPILIKNNLDHYLLIEDYVFDSHKELNNILDVCSELFLLDYKLVI